MTQTFSYRTKIHSCLFNPLYCSLSSSWTQFQTHTIIPLYFKKGFDHHASLYIIVFSKAIGIVYLPSGKCSMNVSWMNSREFKFSLTNNLIFLQCLTFTIFLNPSSYFFFWIRNIMVFILGNVHLSFYLLWDSLSSVASDVLFLSIWWSVSTTP